MQVRNGMWVGVAAILVLAVAAVQAWAEEQPASEEKVAVVNGTIIPKAQLEQEVSRFQLQYSMTGKPVDDSAMAEIREEALEKLIETELLFQESKKQGIKVDEAEFNKHLADMKKRYPTEDEFNELLAKMNLTEETLKSQFERGRAIQQLIDGRIAQGITVTEEDSRSYYENNKELFNQPAQMRASHILIKVEPGADEEKKAEARKEIEDIREKVENDEDFAALAREFSQGPSGPRGGDLGYFGRGQMVKSFEDAAFALEPGGVSDIVETRFGYHLIKVIDKKSGGAKDYAEVKPRLDQYLKQQKTMDEMQAYVERLKEDADVERFSTE